MDYSKTYVFDLDGTLIDSKKRHCLLMEWLLLKNQIDVSSDFDRVFMSYKEGGRSGMDFLTVSLKLPHNMAESINSEWVSHIEDDHLLIFDKLYEDTLDTLAKIKSTGDRIVFLTSRNNDTGVKDELQRLGLSEYASELIIVKPGKKNGKNVEVEMLKKKYKHTVVIGDTESEYYAAEKAAVDAYILNRGFRNEEFWRSRGVLSHNCLGELI